ncbi:hypothetical protein H9L39_14371 [Fusarium oxysporum f. sp. albedinis]|nr:hypothetical protein H9L39_14371 [Fusarium oxysporum f. sp. albedinis]
MRHFSALSAGGAEAIYDGSEQHVGLASRLILFASSRAAYSNIHSQSVAFRSSLAAARFKPASFGEARARIITFIRSYYRTSSVIGAI